MVMFPFSYLPDEGSWRLDEIDRDCHARAETLKAAGPPAALLKALEDALDRALEGSNLRIGREQKEDRPDDRRAVVQFHVGIDLFDSFSILEPGIARTSEGTISAAYGSRARSSKVYAFASMIYFRAQSVVGS